MTVNYWNFFFTAKLLKLGSRVFDFWITQTRTLYFFLILYLSRIWSKLANFILHLQLLGTSLAKRPKGSSTLSKIETSLRRQSRRFPLRILIGGIIAVLLWGPILGHWLRKPLLTLKANKTKTKTKCCCWRFQKVSLTHQLVFNVFFPPSLRNGVICRRFAINKAS